MRLRDETMILLQYDKHFVRFVFFEKKKKKRFATPCWLSARLTSTKMKATEWGGTASCCTVSFPIFNTNHSPQSFSQLDDFSLEIGAFTEGQGK